MKEHMSRHKRNHDHCEEDSHVRSNSYLDYDEHNRRKKHKKHKHNEERYDYESRKSNSHQKALRGEVIEIHGSSSEGEDECNSKPHHSNNHSEYQKYKSLGKKHNDKYRHKIRSRSNSRSKSPTRDEECENKYRKHKHHTSKKEDRLKRKVPDYEENSNHRRRNESDEEKFDIARRIKVENDEENERHQRGERKYSDGQIKVKEERNRGRRSDQSNRRDDQLPSGSRGNRNRRSDGERENHEWGKRTDDDKSSKQNKPAGEAQKPNFGLSGKLAEDTNTYNGVVIKYSEPPEARIPKKRWRLYPFKGDEALPPMYIHRQSAYLLGRDRKVVDIPIDHPSCSKQHAALQYRLVSFERRHGGIGKQIRLYIIDLESANGTFINNNKIEPKKYVELFERDVIKFGFSSREYVLLHEHSKDDDVSGEEEK